MNQINCIVEQISLFGQTHNEGPLVKQTSLSQSVYVNELNKHFNH